ncbi:hypothetical protein U1Q18_027234 [Sarracenia purpurea var. burkii]
MVSTRRSPSLSGNNTKKSSPEEKPSSKRQKSNSGEKRIPDENTKGSYSPPALDPLEHDHVDTANASCGGGEAAIVGKGEVAQAVAVDSPMGEGSLPIVVDNPKSSFSSWSAYQKQNRSFESTTPWCKLLSENPQSEGTSAALLESRGSKGHVKMNGKIIKTGTSVPLKSGDEIFQQLLSEPIAKMPSSVGGTEVQSTVGKMLRVERRAGDHKAVAGASILASLSSRRQDLPHLKPTAQASSKTRQVAELAPIPVVHESMEVDPDGLEVNLATNTGSDKAADVGASSKNLALDSNLDCSIEADDVFEERQKWIRESQGLSLICAAFKEGIQAGIVDGKDIEVSFDNFPYYLSENTKNVLIAASYIHLKRREQVKYTSELPTMNPRILLSGPAGSEIYQEILAKALARYFGAKLLVFDHRSFLGEILDRLSFLGALSLKEADPVKKGYSAEKLCNINKQSARATDLAKGTSYSAIEADVPSSSNVSPACGLESQPKIENDTVASPSGISKSPLFKIGDRVRFVASTSGSLYSSSFPSRAMTLGIRGKVLLPFEDNPLSKIGVRFDNPITNGVDLGGLCERGRGFFCNVNGLCLENMVVEELDKILITTLFEGIFSGSRNSPFILFMKDAEKSIVGDSDVYSTFKSRLDKLPDNTVIIGSHIQMDHQKEKDSFGRVHERGIEVPKATKLLTKLFPNKVTIHMPQVSTCCSREITYPSLSTICNFGNEPFQDEALLVSWKCQLERDAEILKIKGNINHLRNVSVCFIIKILTMSH